MIAVFRRFGQHLQHSCSDLFENVAKIFWHMLLPDCGLRWTTGNDCWQCGHGEFGSIHALGAVEQQHANGSMYVDRGQGYSRNDKDAKLFNKNDKIAYGALEHGQFWCLLTNDKLLTSTFIGAHLFEWEWTDDAYLLGVQDINDTRNGLPLWKPLEWAYDSSRLCFMYNKATSQSIANILDPSILPVEMSHSERNEMGAEWVEPSITE